MTGETAISGKYAVYPEYKDSGVEWLGEVPIDWDIKKLKYICKVQTGTKNTENAVEEGMYPFFVRSQKVERINSFGADCEAVLTAGDGVGVGRVFHYIEGKFDYHQRVYMLNNFGGVLGRFIYYYLSNNFYKVALEGNAKSTVDSLRLPQFLNFEFSLPKIEVQNTINDFLDHETAKIDTLIDKQQQLITLLKEKRQAVISHAVTKGLNPNAPMRDSGVEWLGEVPAHWETGNLRWFINIASGEGLSNTEIENFKYGKFEFRVIGGNGTMGFTQNVNTTNKAFAVGRVGALCGNVHFVDEPCWITDNALKISYWAQFDTEYLYFLLTAARLNDYASKSAQPLITGEQVKSLQAPIPPKSQQVEIGRHIRSELDKFGELISKNETAINLIKERRTALISAAVTGKIDVRNWKAA